MSDHIADKVVRRIREAATSGRVARRVLAKGLAMGKTYQNPKIRIHRYRDQVRVTDLTNAGKRGKKVPELTVLLTYSYEGDKQGWFDRQTMEFLIYARSGNPYDQIKGYIKGLQRDFPDDIHVSEDSFRGIDVEPYGQIFEMIVPTGEKSTLDIKSSPTDFRVISRDWLTGPQGNGFFQDTTYRPYKKKDAITFYGWMKDNSAKLKSLKSILELRELWKKEGIQFDYH